VSHHLRPQLQHASDHHTSCVAPPLSLHHLQRTSSEHREPVPATIDARNSSSPAPSSTSILAGKWQQQPSQYLSNQIVRETLILEREHSATCQAAIGQSNWSTGQHWSNGQSQQSTLVKTAKMVK